MRFLVLLLLAGCSGPTYQRGAYPVRPPPPSMRPGHGAPVVGQPGAQSMELPRTPHRRVLPETPATRREPGLWSGDQPRAAKTEDPNMRPMVVWGIPIPSPRNASTPAVRTCGHLTDAAFGKFQDLVSKLDKAELHCEVAREFLRCIRREGMKQKTAAAQGKAGADARLRDYEETHAIAIRFQDKSCADIETTSGTDDLERALQGKSPRHWREVILADDETATDED